MYEQTKPETNMTLEICSHQEAHKPVIWHLFQFYCYDTSVYDGYDVEESGLYRMSAEYFSQYWLLPNWRAHVLRWNGAIAGFVLLEDSELVSGGMEIADLFVMSRFRRLGIANQVVNYFMRQRTVPWTVTVFDDAADAKQFWQQIFSRPEFVPDGKIADPDDRAAQVYLLQINSKTV